jgi:t-SNARE complex subunit (syntaxin)
MGLNERQQKVIELYSAGETVTNMAKILGVSRNTIYADLNLDDVKDGVNKCLTELKTQSEKKITQDLDLYISELKKIALTSKSEKNKLDAIQYILNRIYGTPTSKVADVTEQEKDNANIDIDKEIEGFVIDFKDVKKVN